MATWLVFGLIAGFMVVSRLSPLICSLSRLLLETNQYGISSPTKGLGIGTDSRTQLIILCSFVLQVPKLPRSNRRLSIFLFGSDPRTENILSLQHMLLLLWTRQLPLLVLFGVSYGIGRGLIEFDFSFGWFPMTGYLPMRRGFVDILRRHMHAHIAPTWRNLQFMSFVTVTRRVKRGFPSSRRSLLTVFSLVILSSGC